MRNHEHREELSFGTKNEQILKAFMLCLNEFLKFFL